MRPNPKVEAPAAGADGADGLAAAQAGDVQRLRSVEVVERGPTSDVGGV
jgi:hypothetical protein